MFPLHDRPLRLLADAVAANTKCSQVVLSALAINYWRPCLLLASADLIWILRVTTAAY
jgi:hypothetical protein